MKKFTSILLIFALSVCLCGCEEIVENINSDFVSEVQNLISEDSDSVVSSEEQNAKSNEKVNSQKEKTENKEKSKEETVTKNETVVVESRLPEVKFSVRDSNHRFTDMVNLPNGGFAVSGHRVTEDLVYSVIQIYDENSNLNGEHFYENGNGFDKIAVCSDGGFVAASYCPPCITRINSDLETEWFMPYESIEFEATVHDIEEISPDIIAVLFVSVNSSDFGRRLKISYLNKAGELIETIDLMKNIDPQDADIIADGNGGFYLLSACNESLAEKYPLVAESYDSSKATEAIIMHFSAERELIWAKTLGGGGDDWIEEAVIDSNGNFYLAVGTNWYGADSFWDMSVERSMPYRRMLVKLNKTGDIVYKVPLSNKGMAVDHVFGIHIKDDMAYVVGMTDYFDGYQIKYPCEQILPEEKQKGERVFCVYNACIDKDGKELDRKIFRCDVNNEPCDSALLLNGSLVIAGKVSADENPFDLKFPSGVDFAAALFVFNEDSR
ncbi:MAG: hypothetical protein IKD04_00890 [Clostridia bacterium]|nr:hypothetical protein [Clostridia bacterium]